MATEFIVRTYSVKVEGFPKHQYLAATPARARVRAWWAYCAYRHVSFREFLMISTLRRIDDRPGLGKPIMVGGLPAFWVGDDRQYIHFVRPHSDVIIYSHPNDVAERAA